MAKAPSIFFTSIFTGRHPSQAMPQPKYAVGIFLCPAAGLKLSGNTAFDRTFQTGRGIAGLDLLENRVHGPLIIFALGRGRPYHRRFGSHRGNLFQGRVRGGLNDSIAVQALAGSRHCAQGREGTLQIMGFLAQRLQMGE